MVLAVILLQISSTNCQRNWTGLWDSKLDATSCATGVANSALPGPSSTTVLVLSRIPRLRLYATPVILTALRRCRGANGLPRGSSWLIWHTRRLAALSRNVRKQPIGHLSTVELHSVIKSATIKRPTWSRHFQPEREQMWAPEPPRPLGALNSV